MKPKAIICDIDGTLAHRGDRGPYEWAKVGLDKVDEIIPALMSQFVYGCLESGQGRIEIILVSGRDEICREETEAWLYLHDIPYQKLFMRPQGSYEDDRLVKQRIYEEHIKDAHDVLFVLDDRDKVVKMWRELGLKCLQVADGNF